MGAVSVGAGWTGGGIPGAVKDLRRIRSPSDSFLLSEKVNFAAPCDLW